jgi:hypothetical protein
LNRYASGLFFSLNSMCAPAPPFLGAIPPLHFRKFT